jgi:hypothetical protein
MKSLTFSFIALCALAVPASSQKFSTTPASKAVGIFKAVCGESLPNFTKADRRFRSIGKTETLPTGQRILSGTSVSLQVFPDNGGGKTCSMSFVTNESRKQVKRTLETLTPLKSGSAGGAKVWIGAYENRAIMMSSQGLKLGNVTQYELVMIQPK